MKLSKEELKNKINEIVTDNEIAITLLEDIEDSMDNNEVDTSEIEEWKNKFNDLQEKYKERFLNGDEKSKKNNKDDEEDEEEIDEKEIIDIKEI